jgi:hypothetical protein
MANTVKDIPVQLKQPKKEAKESSIGDRPMTKKVDLRWTNDEEDIVVSVSNPQKCC